MKNNLLIVSIAFLVILVLLINPLNFWMPTELEYLSAAALAVVAAIFAGLVMGEEAKDEREEEIRAKAARAGYLSGIYVLVFAIAYTILVGRHVNGWIPFTLIMMILVRMFVRSKVE